MSIANRNTQELIELRKEIKKLKTSVYQKFIEILPIIIPFAITYVGFAQYLKSENAIDKRKYNNSYYEERYRVLKNVSKDIAEINMILAFKDTLNSKDSLVIRNSFIDFTYGKIVLDSTTSTDRILVKAINDYQTIIYQRVKLQRPTTLDEVDKLNLQIISLTGSILRHEKDSINSAN